MTRTLLGFVLIVACSEPQFRESACDNGVDDDADGVSDCDDPDCLDLSDVCETSLEACRDGVDRDRDGDTDCEDARCVAGGHCDTFDVDLCNVATGEGCPIGMGCYTNVGYSLYACARAPENPRLPRETCDLSIATTGGCGEGSHCRGVFCAAACLDDRDCSVDSTCVAADDLGVGFCHHQCSIFLDNCGVEGVACVPLQLAGLSTDDPRSALGICTTSALEPGTGGEGESCDDRQLCASGLLCVPDEDADKRCRRPCEWIVPDGAGNPCPAGEQCSPLYPTHPSLRDGDSIQGFCLPMRSE